MRVGRSVAVAGLIAGGLLAGAAACAQADVRACATISKRSERLACYDDVARGQAPGRPAAPARAGEPIARGLGSELVKDRRPERERPVEVSRVVTRVVSASDNGTGQWRFALANGTVWQMPQAEPYFTAPARGEVVRIRKGAIGSYLLDSGMQSSVKVTRVR